MRSGRLVNGNFNATVILRNSHFILMQPKLAENEVKRLRKKENQAIIRAVDQSGRGAARLARLHGVQEVEGSNPFAPTDKEPS
jgi:hypothetical protein